MTNYPRVGTKWEIKIGPDIPKFIVEVISSGHGAVAVKQVDGKYTVCIDILQWHRLYNAVSVEN